MLRLLVSVVVLGLGTFGLAFGVKQLLSDENEEQLHRGQQLMASKRFDDAARVFEGVQGDLAVSGTVLEAALLRSKALTLGGKAKEGLEAARRTYEALPEPHPARGRARYLMGEALEQLGQSEDEALLYGAEAEKVLGEKHRARVAGYYLALAAELARGAKSEDPLKPDVKPEPARAAEHYLQALRILTGGEPLVGVTLPRGRNLIAAGQVGPAAAELQALLETKGLKPAEEAEARFLRARALAVAQQAGPAREELARLLALPDVAETPYEAQGLILLGDVSLIASEGALGLQQAVQAWRRFLARHPDREEASSVREKIASSMFDAGENEAAIAAWQDLADDAKATRKSRALALFSIGVCHQRLEDFDKAREALRHYAKSYPDDERVPAAQSLIPELLLEKAKTLRAREHKALAVTALREYLVEFPLSERAPQVAVEVGLVLRESKNVTEAAQAFRAARERYRQHDREQAGRAGVLLGVLEEEDRRDLEAAIEAYRDVTKSFSGTRSAAFAAQRIQQMEAIEISLHAVRMFGTHEAPEVKLSVRNVADLNLRIYRLNARDYFERRGTLEGATAIEVALVKATSQREFPIPDYRRYRKDTVSVRLEEDGKPLGEGAYLVAAEAKERRSVVLVVVSSIRLVVKESPHEVFVWAVDAASGEPKEGVSVLVRGSEVQATLKTQKDGVARLTHDKIRGRCEVLGVFGRSVAPGMAPEPGTAGKETLAARAAFTFDRPLYRPGSEIRWRAVLRTVKEGAFQTPPLGDKVRCELHDANARVVGATTVRMGSFGTVHGSFPTSSEGAVGTYQLRLVYAGQTFQESVEVREYKKPEYRVAVTPKRRGYRPGDEADFEVGVEYFFGGPVREAAYEWRIWKAPLVLDTTRYLSHAWYLRAVEASKPALPGVGMTYVAHGSSALDAEGRATFTFRTSMDPGPMRYVAQVVVKDSAGQWVSGSGVAHAGPIDRFAVVLPDRRTLRVGDSVEVRVVTPDLNQVPVATRGRLKALVERRAADGKVSRDEVLDATVDTGLEGEARVRLQLPEAGDYLLRFEGEDAHQAPVVAEARLVVTGKLPELAKEAVLRFEKAAYKGGETARMHLSLPKAERPVLLTFEGETVLSYRILRPAEASAVLPITLEADLAPNVTVAVAAPYGDKLLTSQDDVVVLRYLEVAVAPDRTSAGPREKMTLALSAKDQMGQPVEASLALRVVDAALSDLGGTPSQDPRFVFNRDTRPHLVRTGSSFAFESLGETTFLDPDLVSMQRAEQQQVQLGVFFREQSVDKRLQDGAYEQTGKDSERRANRPSPTRSLGGQRDRAGEEPSAEAASDGKNEAKNSGPDSFAGGENLERFRSLREDSLSSGFAADLKSIEFDADSAPEMIPELREHFQDVAGWWPDVTTDKDGNGRVTLDLPDNLTTWDALASGTSSSVAVGQGAASFKVTQDVLLRVDRPRYLNSRDRLAIATVVHTNLEGDTEFRQELESRSPSVLDFEGMTEASYRLGSYGSERRSIWARARAAGLATLEGRVLSNRGSDAVKIGVPVIAFGEPWRFAESKDLIDRADFSVEMEHAPVPGSERYSLIVQGGLRSEMLSGLGYLMGYPHACLEQTFNRFAPAVLLSRALREAGLPPAVDPKKLKDLVAESLVYLQTFQAADGTFAYWPKGPFDVWATALALETLARVRGAGLSVPTGFWTASINGARHALKQGGPSLDQRAALLLALVRAERGDAAVLNSLFRERSGLSTAGLSRLLLSCHASERPAMVRTLFEELKARRKPGGSPALPFTGRPGDGWLRSDLTASALALLAYEAAGASSAETEDLVKAVRRGLERRHGGTQSVALALEALSSYIRNEGGLAASGEVRLLVDGKPVAKGNLDGENPVLTLDIPAEALAQGTHRVRVEKEGGEAARCRLVLKNTREATSVEALGNVLTVDRRVIAFQDPDAQEQVWKPGYEIVKPQSRPRAEVAPTLSQAVYGQKVTIELEVVAREDVAYLALSDPQFAGLDVLESGIRGNFDRHERRNDRLMFFKNRLTKGEKLVVRYPAYAVYQGSFTALPASTEEMYFPERFGRSASQSLEIVSDVASLARVAARKPTPDELYHRGRAAFAKKQYADALGSLLPLVTEFDLQDEIHDQILATLLRCRLRLDRGAEAVKTWEDLQLRNPGKATLSPDDRERLGRAYLSVQDAPQARAQFQSVVLAAFDTEVEVVATYEKAGQVDRAVAHLMDTVLRYPPVGQVTSQELHVAAKLLALEDASHKEALRHLPEIHRKRWKDAAARWLSVMAWYPGAAVAEAAAHSRVRLFSELALVKAVVAECERYIERQGETSRRADEVTHVLARALFSQGKYDECAARATKVWKEEWPLQGHGQSRSRYRFEAGYLLGKVAHVKGDYAEAVRWYGEVKGQVPDALQSHAFFTAEELSIEPVVRMSGEGAVEVPFQAKNLREVRAQVYPVDVSVLFAVKKSFDRLNTAELSGIEPAVEVTATLDLPAYTPGTARAALGSLKNGAYLVVLRAGKYSASTLLLVSKTRLTIQRSNGAVRVYLVDGNGKPIPEALVKLGINGRIFHSGRTDERGMLDVRDPGAGRLTVVAERGDAVAVGTHD